jgi:phosphoglycerate dehydrogenase-like enzyme
VAIIVAEDDRVLRFLDVLFEPRLAPERATALADYFSHETLDLGAWKGAVRRKAPGLFPSTVRWVSGQDALREAIRDADAVVVEKLAIGTAELMGARSLAVVCKFGAITDNIDLAACRRRRVPVHAVRRRTNIAVAEHVFALMLASLKRLPAVNGYVTEERMRAAGSPYRPYDRRHAGGNNYARIAGLRNLSGLTLGLLGMGEIGREVAARARAFGMNLIYHQRHRLNAAAEAGFAVRHCTLHALFSAADVVSVHVPLSPATRGMVGDRELRCMKPGSLLVNTSRAEIVERAALTSLLKSGTIRAALDVQYDEPVTAGDPLLALDNVLLTPHIAGGPRVNPAGDIEEIVSCIWGSMRGRSQATAQRTVKRARALKSSALPRSDRRR